MDDMICVSDKKVFRKQWAEKRTQQAYSKQMHFLLLEHVETTYAGKKSVKKDALAEKFKALKLASEKARARW